MNDKYLDTLLRTPLPTLDDAGFSASVMAQVAPTTHPLEWLEVAVLAISAVLALLFLPLHALTNVAVKLSAELASSTAAATACLAIIASLYLLRRFETD
jgi:hypothetical protein